MWTSTTPMGSGALGDIPRSEKGEPVYEQAEPATAWQAILEETGGDTDMAASVVDDMIADKEAAVKKAEKAKPKHADTVAGKIAAQKERKAAIERAKAELGAWKKIAAAKAVHDDAVAERKSAEAKRQDEQLHEAAVAYNAEATESASGQADIFSGKVLSKEEILKTVTEHFKNATRGEQKKLVDAAVDKRKQAAAERGGRGKESEQTEHAAERGEKGSTHIQGESDSRVPEAHVGLNENEVDELVSHMENSASDIPQIELTPSNWFEQFGENGMVSTPMGEVKMGENQIVKLFEKGRSEQFGMIKPTLEHPQVIIEVPSEAIDGNTERTSSLLFIKTFIGKDGKKVYYFKSVTVRKDGLEVSISSHYDRAKRVKEALKKGELLYRFDGGAQTERHPADASVTTPHDKMQGEDDTIQTAASQPHGGTSSVSKDSASEAKQQEGGGKSAVAVKEMPKKDNDDGPDGPTGGKGKPKGGMGGYSISPTTYTNKKGKTTDMSLLKFDNELTPEQERAVKEFAKERTGECPWLERPRERRLDVPQRGGCAQGCRNSG